MARAFVLSNESDSCAVHIYNLERASYIWVGAANSAPMFGALCAAVPPVRPIVGTAAEASATNLLGDSSAFEDVAARLSKRTGKLVLMSSALGQGEDGSAFSTGDTAWLEQQLFDLLSVG